MHGRHSGILSLFELSGIPFVRNDMLLGKYVDHGNQRLEVIIFMSARNFQITGICCTSAQMPMTIVPQWWMTQTPRYPEQQVAFKFTGATLAGVLTPSPSHLLRL